MTVRRDVYPFYIDTSIIDIDSMINHPVLVFVDGTSPKSPTSLFTNCNSNDRKKKNKTPRKNTVAKRESPISRFASMELVLLVP